MQVHFERSGGFAGLTQKYSVSEDNLPEEDRQKLSDLVAGARFFDQPPVIRRKTASADQFQYKIAVNSGDRAHEVQVDEGAVPDELKPLIGWLQTAARKR
ncbi:MAG TPA: protealysin inhibitor emfourin [Candidatus Angelobacter sp.]|nr:protealysin inhibitor emfourin [Candidatus Angelobacter sp.]